MRIWLSTQWSTRVKMPHNEILSLAAPIMSGIETLKIR